VVILFGSNDTFTQDMTRLLLPYNKTILKLNIIFSSVLALISSAIIRATSDLAGLAEKDPPSLLHLLIWYFIIWILTGGFFLSAFYFDVTRKNEYYFYYNLGISKIKLFLLTYSLHLIFILPLLYVLRYV
jgi:hypothetical protein